MRNRELDEKIVFLFDRYDEVYGYGEWIGNFGYISYTCYSIFVTENHR